MTIYVFGPVNGDLASLNNAISQLDIDMDKDKLWFSGNLIGNEGNELALLERVKDLGKQAVLVLGEHELECMAVAEGVIPTNSNRFYELLQSAQCAEWMKWLSLRPLLHHELDYTLVHAGLPAEWSLSQARTHAIEAESSLSMGSRKVFFENVFAEKAGPSRWHAKLRGWKRTRFIISALTRMSFLDEKGRFDFSISPESARLQPGFLPWYLQTERALSGHQVISAFALQNIFAIPHDVIALQEPHEQQVLKVLRLSDEPEMFSFLRG